MSSRAKEEMRLALQHLNDEARGIGRTITRTSAARQTEISIVNRHMLPVLVVPEGDPLTSVAAAISQATVPVQTSRGDLVIPGYSAAPGSAAAAPDGTGRAGDALVGLRGAAVGASRGRAAMALLTPLAARGVGVAAGSATMVLRTPLVPWTVAPTVVGAGASSSGDLAAPGATTNITLPSGVAADDVVIVVFGSTRNAVTSPNIVTAPAGWTAIAAGLSGNDGTNEVTLAAFWALGSVAALNFSNSQTAGLKQGWVCVAFTGADNAGPIDATGGARSGAGSGTTLNNVDVATEGAWHCAVAVDLNSHEVGTSGPFTAVSNGSPPGNASALLLYNSTPKSPGPTGTVTLGLSVSDPGDVLIGLPFAIRPVAPATVVGRGTSSGTGALSFGGTVARKGTGVGVGRGSGTIAVLWPLSGSGAGVSRGSATMELMPAWSAVGRGASVGRGTAAVKVFLSGSGAGVSAGSGRMQGAGTVLSLAGVGRGASLGRARMQITQAL